MPEITEAERRHRETMKALATQALGDNLSLAVINLESLLEYVALIETEAESKKRAAERKERELVAREEVMVAQYQSIVAIRNDMPEYTKRLEQALHRYCLHPDYEYDTTKGPRKAHDGAPPYDDGRGEWETNDARGDRGFERFEYHEECYWRRLKPPKTEDDIDPDEIF